MVIYEEEDLPELPEVDDDDEKEPAESLQGIAVE
jgi:hypothetical protein